ncbi:MAG TPA: hypothetical protein PKD98_28350 [Anaerolineae bacterium]|nr:hypothetical protein [Anaerolineae bacterium]
MTHQVENYNTIFETVRNWPVTERLSLMKDILNTLPAEMESAEVKHRPSAPSTLEEALGLLAGSRKTAPSDEEIQSILHERRWEEYV